MHLRINNICLLGISFLLLLPQEAEGRIFGNRQGGIFGNQRRLPGPARPSQPAFRSAPPQASAPRPSTNPAVQAANNAINNGYQKQVQQTKDDAKKAKDQADQDRAKADSTQDPTAETTAQESEEEKRRREEIEKLTKAQQELNKQSLETVNNRYNQADTDGLSKPSEPSPAEMTKAETPQTPNTESPPPAAEPSTRSPAEPPQVDTKADIPSDVRSPSELQAEVNNNPVAEAPRAPDPGVDSASNAAPSTGDAGSSGAEPSAAAPETPSNTGSSLSDLFKSATDSLQSLVEPKTSFGEGLGQTMDAITKSFQDVGKVASQAANSLFGDTGQKILSQGIMETNPGATALAKGAGQAYDLLRNPTAEKLATQIGDPIRQAASDVLSRRAEGILNTMPDQGQGTKAQITQIKNDAWQSTTAQSKAVEQARSQAYQKAYQDNGLDRLPQGTSSERVRQLQELTNTQASNNGPKAYDRIAQSERIITQELAKMSPQGKIEAQKLLQANRLKSDAALMRSANGAAVMQDLGSLSMSSPGIPLFTYLYGISLMPSLVK
jgi:hypothetical protein